MFDWRNPKISNWKKLLRIKFNHGFNDIDCRGLSAQEIAIDIIRKHEKELAEDELEFVKGLLK
jgi:hypothetical protein